MAWRVACQTAHLALAASLFVVTSAVTADVVWPVGKLDVQGTAVVTKASGGTVTINNSTYTWFSGDQVTNRSGQSLLILDNGASFGLGEQAQASVSVTDELTSIDINQGSVLFTTEANQPVELQYQGLRLVTRADNLPNDAATAAASVGLIQPVETDAPSSAVQVEMLEGTLFTAPITAAGTPEWYALSPGSEYQVTPSSVRFADGTAGGETPQPMSADTLAARDAAPNQAASSSVTSSIGTAATMAEKILLGGFAVAVTASSTFVVAFEEDDEPVTEPPVSP